MKILDAFAGCLCAAAVAYVYMQPLPVPPTPEPVLPTGATAPETPTPTLARQAVLPADNMPRIALINRYFNRFGLSCDVEFSVTVENSIAHLSYDSPCQPEQQVDIRHAGMHITLNSTDAGTLRARIPVLDATSDVTLVQANGAELIAELAADTPTQHRIVLEWDGPAALELHAFAFGAGPGDDGHVWLGARGKSAATGTLQVLGNLATTSRRAQMFVLDPVRAIRTGEVRFQMVAPVTRDTCDTALSLRIARARPGTPPDWEDVTLMMPDCARVGELMRLNSIVPGLRLPAET